LSIKVLKAFKWTINSWFCSFAAYFIAANEA
jgi:hypothetical protein